MIIKGVVEDIIFRNDSNGYSVVDLSVNDELVTATGVFSTIFSGEELELEGEFTENQKYGKQFAMKNYKSLDPQSINGIQKYLGSGIIRGIGEATATRIVEHFGMDTLNIIEFNPGRLSEIRGISPDGAIRIGEGFAKIKKMKDSVLFLQKYEISINMALRIFDVYGEKTKETVNKNPYQLVEDIDGIGFLTADKIAKKMGIDPRSEFRMRAGILHVLKNNSDKNGSTFMPREELENQVYSLLCFAGVDVFSDAMLNLKLENTLKTFQFADENEKVFEGVALAKLFYAEQTAATKLILLLKSFNKVAHSFENEIKEFEHLHKITFHDDQKTAIELALNEGVSIVTGGPGTGKTTIVKCICEILTHNKKRFMLLAPTGRASKRLSESTGFIEAKTIHRGLEVEMKYGKQSFKYNEENKLETDFILVDEVSMVDINLLVSLLKAIKAGTQLVFVGDKNQLASVGAGNILADCLNSDVIPKHNLTQIYRQSENSLIVLNAHKINSGEMPLLNNSSADFFFENKDTPEEIAESVINLVSIRLPKFLSTDAKNIQVLAPMKIGKAGVDILNKSLQEKINPPRHGQFDIEFERVTFRIGDKIMQTQNNYDMIWTKGDGLQTTTGTGVYNGDIGIIEKINHQTGESTILFDDGRRANLLKQDLYQITLAYAITVHKSQGCEFEYVIIPITAGANIIYTRNLLYTAVTRAKKLVVLVGNKTNINRMVKNNYTAKRFSKLKQMLCDKEKEFKDLYE